jgi:hypothetical protein
MGKVKFTISLMLFMLFMRVANVYPADLRAVTVHVEGGLATLPQAGITYYVNADDDYTFDVYGEPGKSVIVITNNPHYAASKGITVAADKNIAGKWTVKISKAHLAPDVYVSYATETKSGTGENGTKANPALADDAVWASGGRLFIQSAAPGRFQIYSVTGQLQKADAVNGNITIPDLPKGIYLVKLNGKTYKVVN